MRDRIWYLVPVILFLVLSLGFVRALWPGHDPHELPSALIDKEAPAFSMATLDGGRLDRASLKTGPVVVNFFASWCIPCQEEQPVLMRLAGESHVTIYGIDYKDTAEKASALLADQGNPYVVVGLDKDGQVGLDFGVYGVPETYVIDGSGHIRKRFVGPLSDEQADQELLPLLKSLGAKS